MAEALWSNCLDRLQEELPEQQFNTWIRPLQVGASENSAQLYLVAPNRFVQDWVSDKFLNRIKELSQQLKGESCRRINAIKVMFAIQCTGVVGINQVGLVTAIAEYDMGIVIAC